MKKFSASMRGAAPAPLVTKGGATLPDCREWSLDSIDRYCEGLKERMSAAVTEAISFGLQEACVRFALQLDGGHKDPLTMYIDLPGLNPGEDDYPPVRLKFSLRDAAAGLMEPMGHAPLNEHGLSRVRNAMARLVGTMDEKLRESSNERAGHQTPPT